MDIQPDNNRDTYSLVFLLQPHFSLLAFSAAADALTTANLVTDRRHFRFTTISAGSSCVTSDLGMEVTTDYTILQQDHRSDQSDAVYLQQNSSTQHPTPHNSPALYADAILVCGGYRCSLDEQPVLTALLRQCSDNGITLGGLWNGIVAVAHAGLMSGFACALHPDNHNVISQWYPTLNIRPDTVVIDRNRLSAAGPNSAFDLMLLLIQRQDGSETVKAIRDILRADVGNAELISNALQRDNESSLPGKLQKALQIMRSNIDEPLDRVVLAQHINMSTRAMERLFKKHINTSPARQYMELRLLRAQELLTQSDAPISEISDACGFISSAHFSRAFSQRFGCAPKGYRQSRNSLLNV